VFQTIAAQILEHEHCAAYRDGPGASAFIRNHWCCDNGSSICASHTGEKASSEDGRTRVRRDNTRGPTARIRPYVVATCMQVLLLYCKY